MNKEGENNLRAAAGQAAQVKAERATALSPNEFLVKVVDANHVNLHIKNARGEKLKITDADKMLLTLDLVEYVKRIGDSKIIERAGYSSFWHSTIRFENFEYTLKMTGKEILEKLNITNRNKNSYTLEKIKKILEG